MPILILPPRQTRDADAIRTAAVEAGWQIEQLASWRAPGWLRGQDLVFYGEPLFADVVTPALGLTLLEPPVDWLVTVPPPYRQRTVRLTTLAAAKEQSARAFIKPAEDKCFLAGVYPTGAALPQSVRALPDSTPVFVSEPVQWEVEYRCFVLDQVVVSLSPDGTIGNGAAELGACYTVLRQALAPICWSAGTERLGVFQAPLPGEPFSEMRETAGTVVHVTGEHDGQVIVVALTDGDVLIAGYRCFVSVEAALASWPDLQHIRVERGTWHGWDWVKQGEVFYQIDQSRQMIDLTIDVPMVVRCRWTP